jgi:radical SAM protein with 4Fe4S-binding SPASM domain
LQGTPYEFFVQWHLTERCNLRCRHCYQDVVVAEMSTEEIYQAIDSIKSTVESWVTEYKMEISPSFHFTGGEPLLCTDLFDILNHARRYGFTTSLLSNGTLITSSVAQQLRQAEVQDIQISLDGLERTHDSIRGKGSFTRALSGIKNLVQQGVSTYINLTLSRLNMEEIEGLVSLARDLGVQSVSYSRLVSCGRGKELTSQILTADELVNLHRRLKKYKDGEVRIVSLDPLALVTDAVNDIPDTEFPIGGCAAGIFGITITSDGSIMPCRRMDLTIGNIKKNNLRQLWVESPVLCALRYRESYHGGCESCRYWPICRGCRAIALAFARSRGEEDYLGPDPQCPYYKARD